MPRSRNASARDKARASRADASAAENLMWELLRGSRTGFEFRREHAIGGYRLDFYCHEALLDVEMDGEQHVPEKDALRDEALLALGIATYRVPNTRFFLLDEGVYKDDLAEIVRLCEERTGRKAFPDLHK
jgi:very-short-patch-repair endonuclease